MITRLKLENFRRHADTEIVIDEGEQIIAVSGKNGAGKSTLLEAIVFALFGQSRHGNRGLDGLIRNGAEIEGMAVELEFTVGDDHYMVSRRRDGKVVSALLSVNGIPLHEGTKDVTAAVVNLLGTDAAGFKLAAVAQQKELDALIRLGPTERVKSISRLLRLDAVTRAKEEMGRRHSKFVTSMKALPTPADRAQRAGEIAEAQAAVAAAEAQNAQDNVLVQQLAAEIANADAIELQYRAAHNALAGAESALKAAQNAHSLAVSELESHIIPEISGDGVDLRSANAQLMEVSGKLTIAEQAKQQAEDTAQIAADVQSAQTEVVALQKTIAGQTRESVVAEAEEKDLAVETAVTNLNEAISLQSGVASDLAVANAELNTAQKRRNALEDLGEECESCGQGITADHKHNTIADAAKKVSEALQGVEECQKALDLAQARVTEAESALAVARQEAEEASASVTAYFNTSGAISDLERRIAVYTPRLQNQPVSVGNITELQDAKKNAEALVEAAEEGEKLAQAHAAAVAKKEDLAGRVERAFQELQAAQGSRQEAEITEELQTSWDNLRTAQTSYTEALRAAGDSATFVETLRGQLGALEATAKQEDSIVERLADFQREGATHALAKRLLTGLESKVGGDVAPSIESSASEILDAMSDGRYSELKLDNKYTPSVQDNGVWRNVQDLSGGEQDLVALAMRLAVAELISARSSTGFGFLILDEVLGSQDGSRRESILSSLRALKRRYGQVWCISHVGGVEDTADRVIEIEIDEDGVASAY